MKINELVPVLTKSETEMNLYVKKADNFSKDMEKFKKVDDNNYELSKKLKADITSTKTSIEAARKIFKAPLLEMGTAIDTKARELAKPFQDMQDEMKSRIDIHEKEEKDRKEAEASRIDEIIIKIYEFKDLELLEKYYKSLDVKDQRRKGIIEAETLRKNNIKKEIRISDINDIKKNIANIDTLEGLETLVVGEYGDDEQIIQALSDRKERITFNIKQKKLKEDQDEIKRKQDKAEAERKRENEKQSKMLENYNKFVNHINAMSLKDLKSYSGIDDFGDMDTFAADNYRISKINTLEKEKMFNDKVEIAKDKINLFQTIEELNNYMNSFIEDEEITNAIYDDYNSKKNSLLKAEAVENAKSVVETNTQNIKKEQEDNEERVLTIDEIPEMLRKIEREYDMEDGELDRFFIINC